MIERLINDMNMALDHNCFLPALAIALMLPDICGKAAYPNKNVSERYVQWYDENVGKYDRDPDDKNAPHLDGKIIYNLRCEFLHAGNPNIDKDKAHKEGNHIDRFVLFTENKQEFDFPHDIIITKESNSGILTHYAHSVSIRRLCLITSAQAMKFYSKHKDLFNFFNYTIKDIDRDADELYDLPI